MRILQKESNELVLNMLLKKIKNFLLNKSHSFKYYKEQYTLLNNQNLEKQRIIDELRNKNKNLEFEIRELTNDNNSKNEKIQEINAQNENMTQILSEIININESICLIEKKISLNKMHNEKCYDNLMMYNNNEFEKIEKIIGELD